MSSFLANGSSEEAAFTSSCCNHCSQPPENDEHSSNVPSDCNCGDCFCRGALPVNDASNDLVFVELVAFMTIWMELEATPVATSNGQLIRHSSALPIDASALEVRASLCCWVI